MNIEDIFDCDLSSMSDEELIKHLHIKSKPVLKAKRKIIKKEKEINVVKMFELIKHLPKDKIAEILDGKF